MKDDLNYSPTDCFETFPFPTALLDSAASCSSHAAPVNYTASDLSCGAHLDSVTSDLCPAPLDFAASDSSHAASLNSTAGDLSCGALLDSSSSDLSCSASLNSTAAYPTHTATRQSLESIGERYIKFRAELMVSNNEGLTSTYNRFHDPSETSSELLELRRLHGEMDQAVLAAYGWSDLPQLGPGNSHCGFCLDYLDTEEDAQLPEDLQQCIDSGELFFWEPDEAGAFEAQVRAYGAVKGKKKFPWRYRWPDDVRDDVLARLLALNAERFAEEHLLGVAESKKKTRKSRASPGKKSASPNADYSIQQPGLF